MDRLRVDYDQLAGAYHERYDQSRMLGVESVLLALAAEIQAQRILEVGCGTGRWLETLRTTAATVVGADASTGMLSQAGLRLGKAGLVAARANDLPFRQGTFDLIFCVNALHHFDDARSFLQQATALLTAGGVLSIIGIDPRVSRRRYYYEYFRDAWDIDLRRYSSFGQIVDWMGATLKQVEVRTVEKYEATFAGEQILSDPFLKKESNSLLALLTSEQYDAGVQEIRAALERNPKLDFHSEITISMITGVRP